MPAPGRTRFARYAFVALVVVIVAVGALVSQRRFVARSLIEAQLRSLGLEEVGHEVERFGPNDFGVRDFRIGGDRGLFIDRVDASYSLASLLAGRLDELHVSGVRLRGALEDGRFTFGALDPALEREGGSGDAPIALPARNITIEDVEIALATPDGPFDGKLAGALRELDDGRISADLTASARHPRFVGDATLDVAGGPEAIAGEGSLTLRLEQADAAEDAPDAARVALAAAISGTRERVELSLRPVPFRYAPDTGETTLHAEGELPATAIVLPLPFGSAPLELRSVETGGHITFSGLELSVADLSFETTLDTGSWLPTGEIAIARLADLQQPARIAPVALTGTVETTPDAAGVDFDLRASEPGGDFAFSLRGRHDRETGIGEARIDGEPFEFAAGGLQPGRVSPLLDAAIKSASGTLDLEGVLAWSRDSPLRAEVELVAHDLDIETDQGDFERVNTAIRLDGPSPWSTPPGQLISIARVDIGLELTNGVAALRLLPDGRIDLESAEWSLADGTIRTRGVIDLDAPAQTLVLELRNLDLAKLLEFADLDGLSGSGRVSGRIPVVRRGSTLEIKGGKLAGTDDGGWVRYASGTSGAGSARSTEDVNVAFKALENFQYDIIEAGLDGDTEGPVTLSVRLVGANPDFLEGHPIDFTLKVESHLVDLLRKENAVQQIPDSIRRRIEAMSGGGS
jgi:hypothetical protein